MLGEYIVGQAVDVCLRPALVVAVRGVLSERPGDTVAANPHRLLDELAHVLLDVPARLAGAALVALEEAAGNWIVAFGGHFFGSVASSFLRPFSDV